jgi:glyoxylase-like metal-dependent hydrolase (beta-lactamase superfamily II)
MDKNAITRVGGSLMNVNSYLVESRDSLVVVDGMLTLSDARAVRRRIDEAGKPLRGLIVTHAHPDHYAGAAEILRGLVGDLVYNGMHAYLADGLSTEWLALLDRLEAELDPAATLYVGHGRPAGLGLIATQRRYIEAFLEAVDQNRRLDPDARRAAVVNTMKQVLPTEDLLFLMELSVDPVASARGA